MATDKVTSKQSHKAGLRKLVIHSTLLSLINPSLGNPTRAVDENSLNLEFLGYNELRQKFLDSFALICSTSDKGKKTASAVCLEQYKQAPTNILRVARNLGVSQPDLEELKKVVDVLVTAAKGEKVASEAENEILDLVADLDKARILSLAVRLQKMEIGATLQLAMSRLFTNEYDRGSLADPAFRQWMRSSPFLADNLGSLDSSQIKALIHWASNARWVYEKHLQTLLDYRPTAAPSWLETLHKIARYHGAVKSMVKFAIKQPRVFSSIEILTVKAPAKKPLPVSGRGHLLRDTVKECCGDDCVSIINQLNERWKTDNAEAYFQGVCHRLRLTLHGEMQLLDFYGLNPACIPQQRFIGTSKKACFLCHEFLLRHPLKFKVSACHQKIYPSWMPPPYREDSILFTFGIYIKRITTAELNADLAAPQRLWGMDSTAGPSLTATATVPTDVWARHMARNYLPFQVESTMGEVDH